MQSGIGDVIAIGFDISAQEIHAIAGIIDPHLAFMQLQGEFIMQEMVRLRNKPSQPLLVTTDDIEVIDIAAIVTAFQMPLHVLVKLVEIYVAEQLARQIADGQAAPLWTVEQALVIR